METYLRTLRNQPNVYQNEHLGPFYESSEQYPIINFEGNSQMIGESLPNDEQLCNFLSSLDNSTSLTFEKLLQSSGQENDFWANNSRFNQPPSMYNFPVPENQTFCNPPPNRPRMIRGCHDNRADQWNASIPENPSYAPMQAGTDLNNNLMPCLDKNLQRNEFSPKRFECTERQCQDFLSNQYLQQKKVECDWNNNAPDTIDMNNNASAVVENFDETYELKVVSFLHHTKSMQTLAGKLHILLEMGLKQLEELTEERQEIEQAIFNDVTPTSLKPNQIRIERLINGYMNEVRLVKRIITRSDVVLEEKTKTENRQLIDSWIGCLENVQVLRQSCSDRSQKEYLSRQVSNLKELHDQTRRIRTCLWCVHVRKTGDTAC